MKPFFKKREFRITKKQAVIAAIGIVLLVAIYWFITHRPAPAPDLPVVAVEPVTQDDVEIYGEYVGRVRAQQFVEVRARVEGRVSGKYAFRRRYLCDEESSIVCYQSGSVSR